MLTLFEGENGASETIRFIEEKGGAGLWTYELKTRKSEWSQGQFALLGLQPGQAEASHELFESLTHPEDRRPPGQFNHIVTHALPINRTVRIIRTDGRIRWLQSLAEVLVDASGAPYKVVGVMFDVTQHHERLQLLQVGGDRFDALVRALHAAIWTARPDGQVVDTFNWTELTGEDPAVFLGSGWLNLMHPDDRQRSVEAWQAALANKTPYEIEHRARDSEGEYRWYKSRALPVLNADGNVREWVGVSVDITAAKAWPTPQQAEQPLTGAQIRAARGILNWSVRDLSENAAVSGSTIRRLEETDGPASPGEAAIPALRRTFEEAGVEFIFPPEGKPGLRPR
ncbi:MAG: PAS domain-containing protein [Pseudorhodoplanes sp.]|nr:hypothetical protein [Pseudorhodoplanes sp.]MBW7948769.1 PAS domain-containing protein [Pseudorhodoplanes sp.]MCZ7642953.1 PAS domain-containing protein [Pseudorhodoplanes sp.]GIK82413.1 MAG: hypothetical protein BroJett024_35180 [Alphaproteobacteria bacterium]